MLKEKSGTGSTGLSIKGSGTKMRSSHLEIGGFDKGIEFVGDGMDIYMEYAKITGTAKGQIREILSELRDIVESGNNHGKGIELAKK